jgi:hypothetical protein
MSFYQEMGLKTFQTAYFPHPVAREFLNANISVAMERCSVLQKNISNLSSSNGKTAVLQFMRINVSHDAALN